MTRCRSSESTVLRMTTNVFTDAMLHGFMWLCEVVVAARRVRLPHRILHHNFFTITLQCVLLVVIDGFCTDRSRGASQDAYNRLLAI